jgi:hypothetical protein
VENRTLLENWLDAKTIDDPTAPAALEEWLIQLAITIPRQRHGLSSPWTSSLSSLKAKRAADGRG